jgi:hypothetical protein
VHNYNNVQRDSGDLFSKGGRLAEQEAINGVAERPDPKTENIPLEIAKRDSFS